MATPKVYGKQPIQIDLEAGEARFDGDVAQESVKQAITAIGFQVVD